MEINITNKKGIKLLTKGHKVEEDIIVGVDSSLFPSGEIEITENGTYDVSEKASAVVNVPIPDGYIQPSGTLEITENGTHDVTEKSSVNVNVSGLAINGIIEQYKVQAGKTVNAGDFVEFVNAVSWGSGTFYSSEIFGVSACKLNENSVLVAYYDESSKYGRVRVLTLSNSTITVGAETVFNSANTTSPSIIALTENTALIVYSDGGNSNYGTAVVVTINDTTITLGTKTVFQYVNAAFIKAVLLSTNKVLVVYLDKSTSTFYGTAIILTISGTSITTGSTKVFNNGDTSSLSCAALNDTKAIVCYKDSGNSSYGTAIILNISGTTISIGSEKVFNSANTTSPSIIALSSTKALVVYQEYSNSNYGTAVVLSINGTTITAGTKTVFNSATTYFISAVVLDENSVLVAYLDYGNTSYGTAVILTINDTAISVGTKTVFHNNTIASITPSCVALSSSSAVVFYNSSGGYYKGLTIDGTTITPNTEVKNETLVQPTDTIINGIANTSGGAGETVEVYVPTPKGYKLTLKVTGYSDGGSFDYATDNGLTGTVNYLETVTLEGVSSVTISNVMVGMGAFFVNDNSDVITDVWSGGTVNLTEDTTIDLNVYSP